MSAARLWRITAPLAVGAALLAIWEAVVRIEDIPPYILPGPLLIAETLWTDGPSLLSSLLVTLRITLAALAAFWGAGSRCCSRSLGSSRSVFFLTR